MLTCWPVTLGHLLVAAGIASMTGRLRAGMYVSPAYPSAEMTTSTPGRAYASSFASSATSVLPLVVSYKSHPNRLCG